MKAVLIKNNTGPASSLYIGEAPKPHRKTPDDQADLNAAVQFQVETKVRDQQERAGHGHHSLGIGVAVER